MVAAVRCVLMMKNIGVCMCDEEACGVGEKYRSVAVVLMSHDCHNGEKHTGEMHVSAVSFQARFPTFPDALFAQLPHL